MKICLSIAGIDPSGGAGVYADLKTFAAFNCYGTAAVSSITFQNTQGVFGAINQTGESVKSQILPILEDFRISAVKTGMLPTQDVIKTVARIIKNHGLNNFVLDPVVRSTSGYDLIDEVALNSLMNELFPLAVLVTPNIPEAVRISGQKIDSEDDLISVGKKIQTLGAKNVLIKGGHFPDSKEATDYLFIGDDVRRFVGEFYQTSATHGTGCTLSSAIAANLALDKNLPEAIAIAKRFVNQAIYTAPNIGKGHSPINHNVKI